jgi:D-3-phosphoglycerate dehydrogenase
MELRSEISPTIFFAERCDICNSPSHMSKLESVAKVKWGSSGEEAVLAAEARDAKIIVSDYLPITSRIMNAAPNLKGLISYGVGFNQIDVNAASERGIFVVNLRGSNSEAVAELTVSMMLALLRNLVKSDQYVRSNKWDTTESAKYPDWTLGKELYEKTVGIVGIGEVGKRVARICAKGFNMHVLAFDPFVTKEQASQLGAELVDLKTLLKLSDIVTVHVPLSAETKGLMGDKEIGLMKKSAYLINTSRGPVLDESALRDALREGRIAGAGLDVFEKEPIPMNSSLLKLGNTVLTPHIASSTREAREAMNNMVVEDAIRIIRGEVPKNLVNRSQLVAKGYLKEA